MNAHQVTTDPVPTGDVIRIVGEPCHLAPVPDWWMHSHCRHGHIHECPTPGDCDTYYDRGTSIVVGSAHGNPR